MSTILQFPPLDHQAKADALFAAKAAELVSEGVDVNSLTEDKLGELIEARLSDDDRRIFGLAHVERVVQVEIGKRIVDCVEAQLRVPRSDIAACVNAFLAQEAADGTSAESGAA